MGTGGCRLEGESRNWGNQPLPFSPNPPPRLKDPVGERAGQALCENGGGRGLCGLGTVLKSIKKPPPEASLVAQWLKTLCSQCRGTIEVLVSELKIP